MRCDARHTHTHTRIRIRMNGMYAAICARHTHTRIDRMRFTEIIVTVDLFLFFFAQVAQFYEAALPLLYASQSITIQYHDDFDSPHSRSATTCSSGSSAFSTLRQRELIIPLRDVMVACPAVSDVCDPCRECESRHTQVVCVLRKLVELAPTSVFGLRRGCVQIQGDWGT